VISGASRTNACLSGWTQQARPDPILLPEPVSDLLIDPKAPPAGPVHQLEPAAIPAAGLRVQRRAMLARSTEGEPVLLGQRRQQPISAPPVSGLRFDFVRPEGS
jgi:hypothetical protein